MDRPSGEGAASPGRPVIVHDRAHCGAALAAAAASGRPVILRSAPGAARYLGPLVFMAMVGAARAAYPAARAEAVLDCADAPGLALAALRAGVDGVRLRARPAVLAKVAAIAGAHGARLDRDRRLPLDLLGLGDPEAACRAWLAGASRAGAGASGRTARRVEKSASLG